MVGASFGFLSVVLGAFGAHGLKPHLIELGTLEVWQTASQYHLVHSVVLFALGVVTKRRMWTCLAFTVGMLVFSGSLYLLAYTGYTKLGAITPVGGLMLLAGWLMLVVKPLPVKEILPVPGKDEDD